MIKPVSEKKPTIKSITNEKKSLALKSDERIQTAEGWKREKRKTKKADQSE